MATSLRGRAFQKLITSTTSTAFKPHTSIYTRTAFPVARPFSTTSPTRFTRTTATMGVHNLKEYVAFHQQKLREASTSSATPSNPPPKPQRYGGVNILSSKSEYETSVVGASDDEVAVIDFFATWCGPCKMIAPVVEKMSNEEPYTKVKFFKIDVDNTPDVAQELGIRAMPTFVIFKGGKEVAQVVGANANDLKKKIDSALA